MTELLMLAPDHLPSDATTTIAAPALAAALANTAPPPCDGPALAVYGTRLAERLGDPLAVALGACLLRRALRQDHDVGAAPSPDTLHRLLLAATTVAMKAHFDDFYVNKYMARIGGLEAPRELAELEAHLFVTLLGGRAQVSAEELRAFLCGHAPAGAPSVLSDSSSSRPPPSAALDDTDDAFPTDDASFSGTLPSIATHPRRDFVSCDIAHDGGDSDATVAAPTRLRKGTVRRRQRRRAGGGGTRVPRAPPTLSTLRGINADPSAEIDAVNTAPFTGRVGAQSPGTHPTHPNPTATQPTTTMTTTTMTAAATAGAAVVHYHYHFHIHHVVYVPAVPAPPPAATAGSRDC